MDERLLRPLLESNWEYMTVKFTNPKLNKKCKTKKSSNKKSRKIYIQTLFKFDID